MWPTSSKRHLGGAKRKGRRCSRGSCRTTKEATPSACGSRTCTAKEATSRCNETNLLRSLPIFWIVFPTKFLGLGIWRHDDKISDTVYKTFNNNDSCLWWSTMQGLILLGQDWLQIIRLDWSDVNRVSNPDAGYDTVLNKYPGLFSDGVGTFAGPKVRIHVSADAQPFFHKARPVPDMMR